MKIEIKKFKNDYQMDLAELYLSSRRDTFNWMPKDHFKLADFIKDTEGENIFVALSGDKVVGFVSLWMSDNFIHHLYVDSNYHGQGIGKKILDFALKQISRPAGLKCVVKNEKAVGFYQSHGWTIRETGDDEMGSYYFLEYK